MGGASSTSKEVEGMKAQDAYGTLAVHLPTEVIAEVDKIAAREDRSRSHVLRRIIERELRVAPEPSIKFARRSGKGARS
jgi:N-acetylglutamate synthase-like GNAT family acetyltransferase